MGHFDTQCIYNNNAERAGLLCLFIASVLFGMSMCLLKLPNPIESIQN